MDYLITALHYADIPRDLSVNKLDDLAAKLWRGEYIDRDVEILLRKGQGGPKQHGGPTASINYIDLDEAEYLRPVKSRRF